MLTEYTLRVLNEWDQAAQTASDSLGYQMMLAQHVIYTPRLGQCYCDLRYHLSTIFNKTGNTQVYGCEG